MRIVLPLSALAIAALAGPSIARTEAYEARQSREQERLEKALAGKAPGKPTSCIPITQVRSTSYFGNRTILYRMNSKLVYRNDPAGGCPGMNRYTALVTRTPTGQLCAGDIAFVRDFSANFTSGACSLGEFVPYR